MKVQKRKKIRKIRGNRRFCRQGSFGDIRCFEFCFLGWVFGSCLIVYDMIWKGVIERYQFSFRFNKIMWNF